jgi:hypothetical protein
MDFNKNNKLKQLHKTIETIVKARQIQKAKVDVNVMKEELTQEELKKFHKPMVDQLTSIVDTTNKNKKSLLPIEDSKSSPIPIESPSTALIPIEHTSKESSKQSKGVLKDSLKNLETTLKNVFFPDEGINENIVKIIYRFNMPSEIAENPNLYEENYNRVI